MILLDREDVMRLSMNRWDFPFCVENKWGHDVLAPGPFVLVVHDEHAWAGLDADSMEEVAGRRIDPTNFRRWKYLADLYAEAMGVSRQGLLLRYASMKRFLLFGDRKEWHFPWDEVYHWHNGGDLAWSALVHAEHPCLKVRMYDNCDGNGEERQVMYYDE